MDFAFAESEQMVIETAAAYAKRWLGDFRARETARCVSDEVHAAFMGSGLALLAEDSEDLAEIGWPARCAVLAALAGGDGGATLALWMRTAAPRYARLLGASTAAADGIGCVHVADAVATVTQMACVPLGGADRVLLLDAAGDWSVVQVDAEPTHALALDAAGPARCAVSKTLEKGATPTDAVVAELRLVAAAILLGVAKGAQSYAATYMETRETFGKTLNQHQGLAFIFADMAMATAGAELLLHKAAWTVGEGRNIALADAYLEAVEAALHTTNYGVQLLGGHGFMHDHPVEKWMREARALSLLFGGVDAARRDAAGGGR